MHERGLFKAASGFWFSPYNMGKYCLHLFYRQLASGVHLTPKQLGMNSAKPQISWVLRPIGSGYEEGENRGKQSRYRASEESMVVSGIVCQSLLKKGPSKEAKSRGGRLAGRAVDELTGIGLMPKKSKMADRHEAKGTREERAVW